MGGNRIEIPIANILTPTSNVAVRFLRAYQCGKIIWIMGDIGNKKMVVFQYLSLTVIIDLYSNKVLQSLKIFYSGFYDTCFKL